MTMTTTGGPGQRATETTEPTIGPEGGVATPPAGGRRPRGLRARMHAVRQRADAGLATAEYAIATVAAAGFAGLLITVLRSNAVRDLLTSIVRSALSL